MITLVPHHCQFVMAVVEDILDILVADMLVVVVMDEDMPRLIHTTVAPPLHLLTIVSSLVPQEDVTATTVVVVSLLPVARVLILRVVVVLLLTRRVALWFRAAVLLLLSLSS